MGKAQQKRYLCMQNLQQMPILDLYNHSEKRQNLAHFAALASLAAINGVISSPEKEIIEKFAVKLDISEAEFKEVMKKENKYPIEPALELKERYKRLHDFFQIIFSDNKIEDDEMVMVKKYAIGIGFTPEAADKAIARSVAIFSGRISFDDYYSLIEKK